MSNPQLCPFEVNPTTGEPFVRLHNHRNIILTPPRLEDVEALVVILNDLTVSDYLAGPPYPYTPDHAKQFLQKIMSESETVLRQLEDSKTEQDPIVVGGCPVRYIREVREDGSDMLIGDIGVMRCMHGELMGPDGVVDWSNKAMREEENNAIPVGDPRIIWSIGDFLAASHHRQGIMTDAVQTVLHDWGIPRMKIRHMWVSAFSGNEGSVKVFLKNRFKVIKTIENHLEAKGKVRGLHLMEWKYDPENDIQLVSDNS